LMAPLAGARVRPRLDWVVRGSLTYSFLFSHPLSVCVSLAIQKKKRAKKALEEKAKEDEKESK